MTSIKGRILQLSDNKGFKREDFFKKINASYSNFRGKSKNSSPSTDVLVEISSLFPEINLDWLLTGRGEMFSNLKKTTIEKEKNMIPLYEDVATIGGTQQVAETTATYNTNIQIDAGDWFNGATAAIRHYGDSMIEYKSGCIIAIRELNNKNEIVWGRNYVIETRENRITKQIAELDKDNIICFSTNTDKHENGLLKHQPITILKEDITKISRVLGSVNKEESTGMVNLI